MARHQAGDVSSIRNRLPVELIYSETCPCQPAATRRENYLQSTWGKRYLKSCDSTLVECLKRSANAPSPGSAWTRGAAIVGFELRGLISDFKLWLSGS